MCSKFANERYLYSIILLHHMKTIITKNYQSFLSRYNSSCFTILPRLRHFVHDHPELAEWLRNHHKIKFFPSAKTSSQLAKGLIANCECLARTHLVSSLDRTLVRESYSLNEIDLLVLPPVRPSFLLTSSLRSCVILKFLIAASGSNSNFR